eukprot:INCI16254.8.p1 GENE.INCI16254.8~~INCI16254.8.p1  ORF type:complete len:1687 (+),score=346.91 INCI16254.8:258-5318(+)
MGQQWAQLLTTSADALENGQQLGLGRAGPWSCDIIVPKKMEAQWSIHGMGFGITRDEFATLFSSTGSHDEHNLDAVWRTFHCARNNGPDASARPKPASETDVIDAVGLVVTYYLLSNAPINSKISAVFNFMDFNNRAWISSSELTILLMSLAYTLQDVATNVARRTSAGLPTSAPDTSATDATSTTHDESDAFIELLLTGSGEAQLSTERMDDGDHKVDYVAFFDGMQRVLANHRARNKRDASGLSALTRILNTLDPSNEENYSNSDSSSEDESLGSYGGNSRVIEKTPAPLDTPGFAFGQKVEVASFPDASDEDELGDEDSEIPATPSGSKAKKKWCRGYISHAHMATGGQTVAVRLWDGTLQEHVPIGLVRAPLPKAPSAAARAQFDGPLRAVGDTVYFNPRSAAASPRKRRQSRSQNPAASSVLPPNRSELISGRVVQRHDDRWAPTYDVLINDGHEGGEPRIITRVSGSELFDASEEGDVDVQPGSTALGVLKDRAMELQFVVDVKTLAVEEPEGAEYLTRLRQLVTSFSDVTTWDSASDETSAGTLAAIRFAAACPIQYAFVDTLVDDDGNLDDEKALKELYSIRMLLCDIAECFDYFTRTINASEDEDTPTGSHYNPLEICGGPQPGAAEAREEAFKNGPLAQLVSNAKAVRREQPAVNLVELAEFEPEGAEYLMRLRKLVDRVCILGEDISQARNTYLDAAMACALPVGEAEVDEMPDEGIKEITNSRMVLAAAEAVLGEYMFPDAARETVHENANIGHHLDSSDSSDEESDSAENDGASVQDTHSMRPRKLARLLQRRVDEAISQWKTMRAAAPDANSHLSPATGLATECIKYLDSVSPGAPGGGLDLHELAATEPEGAAYLQQCRQVIEQVATEAGKVEHPKLSDVSESLLGTVALANALPLRADIVDGMQEDSRWLDDVVAATVTLDKAAFCFELLQRYSSKLQTQIKKARTALSEARNLEAAVDDDGNDLSEAEPEGVEYIYRLRRIAEELSSVDQIHFHPDDSPVLHELRSQIALTLALPAPSQALDHLDSAGKQEISVLRSIFEGTVDPLDLYLFQEAKFSQAPATQANNLSNPAVASIAAVPSALPKLVPVDSIVQTAGIVTSFARRDLDQLAKFEPEGAEYLQRLRNLIDSLALISTPVGSRTDVELQQIASSINLVTAFPVREDVVDDMDDEGLRELSQSMQLLQQASRSLQHHLDTDHELIKVVAQAKHLHEGPQRNLDTLAEVEPEGVEYLRRLRKLIGVVASVDQESDMWNGTSGSGATTQDPSAAASFRQSLYQPLAMSVLWPVAPDLVDQMDEAGRVEMENLRRIIAQAVVLLGRHLHPDGSQGASTLGKQLGNDVARLVERGEQDTADHIDDWDEQPEEVARILKKLRALLRAPGQAGVQSIDTIVTTAQIWRSGGRRNLQTLAEFEPEGAEYLQRLRSLCDSLADIEIPVKPLDRKSMKQLNAVYAGIGLVTAFPVRPDVVDDLDEEGERELVQLMQLLIQASRTLRRLLTTDHQLVEIVKRAREIEARTARNLAELEDIEPEGVEYIRRLRALLPIISSIDQDSDKWRGDDGSGHCDEMAANTHRASLLQPLALVVMWPVGEEMVDNMDDAGKAEIETLRALISDCVSRLGQQVKTKGGEGAAKVAEGTFEGDFEDDSQVSDRVRALQARLATLDRFGNSAF